MNRLYGARRPGVKHWDCPAMLPFTKDSKVDLCNKVYTTIFFMFYHIGVYYAPTHRNLSFGFRRVSCARPHSAPDKDFHDDLVDNQLYMLTDPEAKELWDQYVGIVRDRLRNSVPWSSILDAVEYVYPLPHEKRKLRIDAFNSLDERGLLLDELFTRVIRVKMKYEVARYSALPRVIGDYSTEGSLLGAAFMDIVKDSLVTPYHLTKGDVRLECRFVKKPEPTALLSCFNDIRESGNKFIFHSDDAILRVECLDGPLLLELDISACDISNGRQVFDTLLACCSSNQLLYRVIDFCVNQCSLPFQIRNPEDLSEKISGVMPGAFEWSGSVLTTALNNNGGMLYMIKVFQMLCTGVTKQEFENRFSDAVNSAGYIVKMLKVKHTERLTFLKTSSCINDGKLLYFMNVGVIFRALGKAKMLIPGRGDPEHRAKNHLSGVLMGMVHVGNFDIINILRKKFIISGTEAIKVSHFVDNFVGLTDYIPGHVICSRYSVNIAQDEWLIKTYVHDDFIDQLRFMEIGDVYSHPFVDIVMHVDYGYPLPLYICTDLNRYFTRM